MNIFLLSVLSLLLSFPVLAQQSFKPDLSKENIKKVHVYRVNSYDYSGGYINTSGSNMGLVLVEFNKPTNYWAIYKFDLNEIINLDYDLTEKYRVSSEDDGYEEKYRIDGITIESQAILLDTLYTREVSKLDTLSYVRYIVDTALHTGYGSLPEIFHYNHGYMDDHIIYYIREGTKIKDWNDSKFYRYGLVDDCNSISYSGFHKLTLPDNDTPGFIDTIVISKIIVDSLRYEKLIKKSQGTTLYDCVLGYMVFIDSNGDKYFASGSSMFRINIPEFISSHRMEITNMGNSMVLNEKNSERNIYRLFNQSYPNSIEIPNLNSVLFYDNLIMNCEGPGCYPDRLEYAYLRDNNKHYIMFLTNGRMIEISNKWKLIKSIGDIFDLSLIKDNKVKEYFTTFGSTYSRNIIFLTPQKKIMIFDNGKFFELTKKKIKEMGG